MKQDKKLLIVDDSEIDREMLSAILEENFDVITAENGHVAIDIILEQPDLIQAVMLDVFMPKLNGFAVLDLMKDHGLSNIPIFLISAEATCDIVNKAAQYNIAGFIRKPFDRADILKRLYLKLEGTPYKLNSEEIGATYWYIRRLEAFYNIFLNNFGKDIAHYKRLIEMMKILLKHYAENRQNTGLDETLIDIVSWAAYFCDIGDMVVLRILPHNKGKVDNTVRAEHTMYGANFIQLNFSAQCQYFVSVCSDMCLHHHERFDGTGVPQGLAGDDISVFAQLLKIAEDFDIMFCGYSVGNDLRFDFVVEKMERDVGAYNKKMIQLLNDCKKDIITFYRSLGGSGVPHFNPN